MFRIHQVKAAAVNEGLREQWKTTNETGRATVGRLIFIYSGEGAFRF